MSFCLSLSGFSASNSPFLFLSLSSFIDLFVVGAVFCLVLVSLVLEICEMAGPIEGDGELLAACVLVICFSPVLVDFLFIFVWFGLLGFRGLCASMLGLAGLLYLVSVSLVWFRYVVSVFFLFTWARAPEGAGRFLFGRF